MTVDLSRYKGYIEAALGCASATHAYADVVEMVAAGTAFAHPGPASIVITQTIDHPHARLLHFFLAGGNRPELAAMAPHILDWGRAQGCTRATLIGRKGWQRTFLRDTGWQVSPLVLMEREL